MRRCAIITVRTCRQPCDSHDVGRGGEGCLAVKEHALLEPTGGFVGLLLRLPLPGAQAYVPPPNLVHAPIAHFALDKLARKGTRRSQGGLVDG